MLVVNITKPFGFASNVPNLLILNWTVEHYTPSSETRRAVTTVSGATKLSVRSQLCTRDGHIVLCWLSLKWRGDVFR